MATYVVGDIQGCFTELQQLLNATQFNPQHDFLWCAGDLVNRGPRSLETLRFFKSLGEHGVSVLGNHDLHLLAIACGHHEYFKKQDTLDEILEAPDRDELLTWLRHRPLLHHDANLSISLIHAGLPPQWTLAEAQCYAKEVETVLQSEQYPEYFDNMYGNKPKVWSNELTGWARLRYITNCFTRLRYCNAKGKLALEKKFSPTYVSPHDPKQPWFMHKHRATIHDKIVFGHWSTLGFRNEYGIIALDTGCVWGGKLTAIRLEDLHVFQVDCPGACQPGKHA